MPEEDGRIFQDFFTIYSKYRSLIITHDEEWEALNAELAACATIHHWQTNPLAWHLYDAILSTFNDLYRNGAQPVLASFLGREDL